MAKTATKTKEAPAKAPAKAKPPKVETALVTVAASAISKDVGPAVIIAWNKSLQEESKANEMLNGVKAKRYDAMAMTTEAIAKASRADKSINLASAFSDDKKVKEILNTQIGIALGFREYTENEKGKRRLVFAKEVAKFFPSGKDVKGSADATRKSTFRSNFIHMVGKCAQAACAIVENKIDFRQDKDSGTLAISGPKVREVFGSSEVLLNEKQTVATSDGKTSTQLLQRPSFAKLAEVASAVHGGTVKGQRNKPTTPTAPVDPDTAIASLCASLVKAISGLNGKATDPVRKALDSVRSACDTILD